MIASNKRTTVKRCEQITLDFERSQFQALSVKDRLGMKMHLGMCKKCRKYVKDSQKLDLWLKRRLQQMDESIHFSDLEKVQLKEKLSR